MRLLRAADRIASPWKNGGGVTREVAASPGADGFDFDWRLSMAEVNQGGPFSTFPGIDRSLAVIEGQMRLTVDGGPPIRMDPDAAPLIFPGDAATKAEVLRPVLDLNLMTRRNGFRGRLTRLNGRQRMLTRSDITLVVALDGIVLEGAQLLRLDAIMLQGVDELPPLGGAAYIAEIYAL